MSADRELLELAAKAVGLEIQYQPGSHRFLYEKDLPSLEGKYLAYWDPLTDDGDALRLLAAMPSLWSLGLKFGSPSIVMDVAWGFKGIKVEKFNGQGTDRASVIRRAIVEAAAEIGKTQ